MYHGLRRQNSPDSLWVDSSVAQEFQGLHLDSRNWLWYKPAAGRIYTTIHTGTHRFVRRNLSRNVSILMQYRSLGKLVSAKKTSWKRFGGLSPNLVARTSCQTWSVVWKRGTLRESSCSSLHHVSQSGASSANSRITLQWKYTVGSR